MARAAEVVVKEIVGLLDELGAALAEPMPATVACDTVRQLGVVRNQVEAAFTAAVGQLATSRAYADEGAANAAAWLRWQLHLPRTTAAGVVATARQLRDMPATQRWFAAGRLNTSQVRLLRSAQDADSDAFARDEDLLLAQSSALWFDHQARAVKHWIYLNDQDGQDRKARQRYEKRGLRLVDTFDDTVDVHGSLDVVSGAIVKNEVHRLEQLLFDADWKAAEARLGRKPDRWEDLDRTPHQRRADALVEMARRSRSLPDGTPRARPLVTVVIDHPTIERLCQLSDGTFVTPGEILPLLCHCDIERVVFGADRRVVDVGARRRFFTGATRRAVEVRDLECAHPACDTPAEDCEIDHRDPWALGGRTTQDNGRCSCRHHNRSRPRSQLGSTGKTDDW